MRWLPAAALAAAATALRAPSTPRRLTPLRLSPAEIMYEAQRDAMAASAEQEGALFVGHTSPLRTKKLSYSKKTKRRGKKASGFSAPVAAESQAEKDAAARWRSLKRDGILKIEGACAPATASLLREYVVEGVDKARRAVLEASDPADESMKRFHATTEQPSRSFFKPRLDDPQIHAGLGELLGAESKLGDLFALACGGDDAVFYDYNALRTEPGCARQPVLWRRPVFDITMASRRWRADLASTPPPPPHAIAAIRDAQVHFDTPFQETPPLFTAFVALQTVTAAMGATLFLPGTHLQCPSRCEFDASRAGTERRDAMLRAADARYALLEPGDVTIFDMRLLHCGTKNLVADAGGRTRYFLNFTFCNPRADQSDLGHVPCIRPGYERRMTLRDARAELLCASPFAALGDGL
ncbi:unnamed protein product [Pelagomonas calceolata]|uniref:Phytanoyl-CoA dioxygenase n=1 Tax=Pelagomonas calceolata TaxID=35677 RepID=A0A7S3ZQ84_9STRA|nr:unnamed protein product [Pelagomonas calceolata]